MSVLPSASGCPSRPQLFQKFQCRSGHACQPKWLTHHLGPSVNLNMAWKWGLPVRYRDKSVPTGNYEPTFAGGIQVTLPILVHMDICLMSPPRPPHPLPTGLRELNRSIYDPPDQRCGP